jgi:hypothetical protein
MMMQAHGNGLSNVHSRNECKNPAWVMSSDMGVTLA